MVPNALQASVCDEQLVSIGDEIALSGNKKKQKKKEKQKHKKAWGVRKKKKTCPGGGSKTGLARGGRSWARIGPIRHKKISLFFELLDFSQFSGGVRATKKGRKHRKKRKKNN